MAGLLNINELLAGLDARRQFAARQIRGLLGDGGDTARQLGAQIGEDATQWARSGLLASKNMRSAIPELRAQAEDQMLANLLNAGGMAGTLRPEQAARIIRDTLKKGGSTTDLATGEAIARGNAVGNIGVAIKPLKETPQTTLPISGLTPKALNDVLERDPRFKGADVLGTWTSEGKVYLDPVDLIKAPFAARLETERRGQKAYYDLTKQETGYGSLDPAARNAMRDAAAKTEAVRKDAPLQVPAGEEFWPWRVQHGGYEAARDPKTGDWFVGKSTSEGEKKLQASVKAAEDWISDPANYRAVWDLNQLKRPAQQDVSLGYAERPKGVPDWIAAQYGPAYRKLVKDAALEMKDQPNAWKFYWTGQMQDDLAKALGEKAGQDAFQQFASNVGATTSGARPAANVRMASYYDARQAQGLPLPTAAPYPYGHNKSGTHLQHLKNLEEAGGMYLPPGDNPKAATFAGNISGQTSAPTIDEVMTSAQELVNQQGKPAMAPFPGTYGVPVEAFNKIVSDLGRTKGKLPAEVQQGLLPSDVQSAAWAKFGGDARYMKPLLEHISDRINVTARVTGLPIGEVKRLFLEKKIPLLSAGLLGLGDGNGGQEGIQ